MDKKTKGIIHPILAVAIFIICQSLASLAIIAIEIIKDYKAFSSTMDTGNIMSLISSGSMAWATIISGIAAVLIMGLIKAFDWKTVLNVKTIDWKMGTVSILAAIFGIFGLNLVEEWIELPNLLEDMFPDMASTTIGFIAIGIAAPVVEEFLFRESIAGNMFRAGFNKWATILISAFVFGAIHGNPAQIPFAAAMGVILAIIYYKTGNIVIPIIIHALNNSYACIQMNMLGEEVNTYSFTDDIGGLPVAIPLAVLSIALCIILLKVFWHKYQTRH